MPEYLGKLTSNRVMNELSGIRIFYEMSMICATLDLTTTPPID